MESLFIQLLDAVWSFVVHIVLFLLAVCLFHPLCQKMRDKMYLGERVKCTWAQRTPVVVIDRIDFASPITV